MGGRNFTFVQELGAFEPEGIHDQKGWQGGFYKFPDEDDLVIYFNAGIVQYRDRTILVTRKMCGSYMRDAKNEIWFWDLVNNVPTNGRKVIFGTIYGAEEHEDARAIIFKGDVLLSCCNFMQGKTFAHQIIARVNNQYQAKVPIHPAYGKNGRNIMSNTGHEKNWLWFDHGGELHCIYLSWPHTIFKMIGATITEEFVTHPNIGHPNYGEVRGGTPPVRVGDEYFSFFHSSMPFREGKRRYFMGAYAFEAKPPFKMTRITMKPLLCGSWCDPRREGFPLVVFPCGALFNGTDWHVVGGCNDCCVFWTKVPHQEMLSLMTKIPEVG